ncbi:MAG TPA: LysR substrate-binding domain-containing protein, partial [Bacteroidales bacterium]|nr:LysR substrate-binding domain-containing protein [Bacteroidales bacterium]
MNLQQLEYIIAVDAHRHFATAAEKCFVTQPTLSMMIQKLEDELGVKIFDRNKQPVTPTEIGSTVISQAQKVVLETNRIKEMIAESKGELKGEFKLGIIPTIAPYLLPRFLKSFTEQYPLITLKISELTTSSLLAKLEQKQLDAAILASPVTSPTINVYPLFFEKFMIYASANYKSKVHDLFQPADLDVNKLWLLQEGHCMRSQVLNLCDLKKQKKHTST